MNLTPLPHGTSPLIQQTSFCSFKSGRSCLLKSTCAAFPLIAWKLIFRRGMLQFSSWVVLFSSSLPFVPHLLSWGPFLMLTITIFLSWDPLHSPCMLSNPYAIPSIIAGQGILFAYLFLVMDNYSSSQFSRISCILLLLILLSMIFHDILFLLSGTFYLVPPCSFAYSADLFWSI